MDTPDDGTRHVNQDGSVVYTLAYPLDDLKEVLQRRLIARDLDAADKLKGSTEQDTFLLARLSGLPIERVEQEIDGYDFFQLTAITQSLIDLPPDGVAIEFDQAAATDASGAVTCPLLTPVKSEGSEISEIKLRRIRPADIKAAEAGGGRTARAIILIARLADVPQATIGKLDAFDYMRLNKVSKDFLEKRPATGARQSSS